MKNRKQVLADFYLDLLALPDDAWRAKHQGLYALTVNQLAIELESDPETIQNIFERMAAEDNPIKQRSCPICKNIFMSDANFKSHDCVQSGKLRILE